VREGWEAGTMAFHAFHTLSFPRPALGAGSECEVAEIAVFGERPFEVFTAASGSRLRDMR
jgi:hypothetical protein